MTIMLINTARLDTSVMQRPYTFSFGLLRLGRKVDILRGPMPINNLIRIRSLLGSFQSRNPKSIPYAGLCNFYIKKNAYHQEYMEIRGADNLQKNILTPFQ